MGNSFSNMNDSDNSLNMEPVTISEFAEFIKDKFEMGIYTPVLGLGKSGIGKTESIKNAVADVLDIPLISMRLVTYDATDLKGFPIPGEDKETGRKVMMFADVNKLPRADRDGEVGILVLDEFTAAAKDVRAAALQLTDSDRSVGDYQLPEKWMIVILGNGPGDGGYFKGLEYALMARSDCFRVITTFKDWEIWAINNDIHPIVINFIEQNGGDSMLHRITPEGEAEFEQKEANPRCWVKLSNLLKAKEAQVGGMIKSRQASIYAGCTVGHDVAAQFATYYEHKQRLIPIDEILDGTALQRDLSSMTDELAYINMTYVESTLISIMNSNKTKIMSHAPLDANTVKEIRNIIKFVCKINKEVSRDASTSVFAKVSAATNLWPMYTLEDEFDDLYPEYLAFGVNEKILLKGKSDLSRMSNK